MLKIKAKKAFIPQIPRHSSAWGAQDFDAYSGRAIRDHYEDLGFSAADAGVMLGYLDE